MVIKNLKNISLLSKLVSIWNKEILIKYPMDLEIKYVWTPKKNIPTIPLIKLINFAPWYPDDTLKKTGKGIPCFWEGFPIIYDK